MDESVAGDIYERNADTVYRLCFSYMKNRDDALDAMQHTFCRMIESGKTFESHEHEKAWLIVVASNVCKNMLKQWWRRNVSILERDGFDKGESETDRELLMVILKLPVKVRIPIYLFYYEGYNSAQISEMMGKSDATIRGYLAKGRELLRKEVG